MNSTQRGHFIGQQALCPHCGTDCSGALGLEQNIEPPAANDLLLCYSCAAVLVLNHDQTLRLAFYEDIEPLDLPDLARFATARAAILQRLQQRTTN
jgi:hypothetical protein